MRCSSLHQTGPEWHLILWSTLLVSHYSMSHQTLIWMLNVSASYLYVGVTWSTKRSRFAFYLSMFMSSYCKAFVKASQVLSLQHPTSKSKWTLSHLFSAKPSCESSNQGLESTEVQATINRVHIPDKNTQGNPSIHPPSATLTLFKDE